LVAERLASGRPGPVIKAMTALNAKDIDPTSPSSLIHLTLPTFVAAFGHRHSHILN
jgi:hypothetical protein